jgi:hypothetical protein
MNALRVGDWLTRRVFLPDFGHVWALFETGLIKFEIGLGIV